MGRRSPDSPDVADYKMDKYHRDSRHRSPASPTGGMEKRRYERSASPEKRRARRSRSYDSPDRRAGRSGGRKQTENPPPSRCVGIFGMNIYTRESQIRELFSKFGQIRRINMITCSQTGRSRGFGFVYYHNLDDAVAAKEQTNGMELDDRRIRVDFSITDRAHTPTPGTYMGSRYDARYRQRGSNDYDRRRRYERRRSFSRSRSRSYDRTKHRSSKRHQRHSARSHSRSD